MLQLEAPDVARAAALLELAGATTLAFAAAGDDAVLEPPPGTAPLWPMVRVSALFPASADLAPLARLLADSCNATLLSVEPLDDAAGQAAGMRAPAPRRIGSRLWLSDAHAAPPVQPGETHVRLAMGLAFGTGEHPTTALCLEWIEALVRPGTRVLDFGCGSGVLAIAALALGASAAWAVDDDEQALTATADNARLNGVADRLWLGAPEQLPKIAADAIVANILAKPLVSLAPVLSERAARGAALALSGILGPQRAEVEHAYAPAWTDFEAVERDGWLRIAARRRGG